MMKNKWIALAVAVLSLGFAGCGDDDDSDTRNQPGQVWFTGRVHDGAFGKRVTDYSITLQFAGKSVKGKVDSSGRYVVGPLDAFHDFSIEIVADGYRSFLSHNEGYELARVWDPVMMDWRWDSQDQSFYFDAYLFPANLPIPATTLEVRMPDSAEFPSGMVKLTPVAGGSWLASNGTGTVNANQRWVNHDDLQVRTIVREFSNGRIEIPENDPEFTYGVEYNVSIFGIPGYRADDAETFTAGLDLHETVMLQNGAKPAVDVVYVSNESNTVTPSGDLVIVFNQPVEWDPSVELSVVAEAIDNGVSIDSPDWDNDGEFNTLRVSASNFEQERGTSFTLEDNVLTLKWSAAGLETTDSDDPIWGVTYTGLNQLSFRRKGDATSPIYNLATMIGAAQQVIMKARTPTPDP